MATALTIQDYDEVKLEHLKKVLKAKSKVDVLRRALDVLEREVAHAARRSRWKKAVQVVSEDSHAVNQEFQHYAQIKRLD